MPRKRIYIDTSIDMDGFSSAYAPELVPLPLWVFPRKMFWNAWKSSRHQKKISMDIAEMNPIYDIDQHGAKLASSLVHFGIYPK